MPGFEPKSGFRCKFYRNTATYASPTWLVIAEIGDLAIDALTMGSAELKRRANVWTKSLATMIQQGTISFRMHFGLDATNFAYLRGAFLAGTVFEVAIMSDDVATPSGAEGWRLPIHLTDFPWDQALEDVSGHDVKANIAYMTSGGTEVDPTWMTVTTTTSASDRRLKQNLQLVREFHGMNVYSYNFAGSNRRRLGMIAQEVHAIHPDVVTVGGADPLKAPWTIDYGRLMAKLAA